MTPRVLIVEDEPMVALDLESILTDAGFAVAGTARSAEKALEFLATNSVDAAILDANLRGESAEPIAERLEQTGTPYAVVSGYSREQLKGALREAPLIGKPFSARLLVQLMNQLVGKEA